MPAKKAKKDARAPVVYVTGKGGSGKTFVAEALASAAAARGLRTCIVTAPADAAADERTSDDGGARRIRCTPAEALGRLLVRTVRFQFIANRLMDSSTFAAVADAAPGIADIAFLGLLDEISADRSEDTYFDLVVVDAPASGHSATLLRAPESVGRVAAFGPAASIVARTQELVSDPRRLRPVIVCPPEELAVVETLSLLESLRDDGIGAPTVVANATYPAPGNEPQLTWMREHKVGKDAELYIGRYDRQCELLGRLRAAAPDLREIPRTFPSGEGFETADEAIEKLLDRVLERPRARRNTKRKTKAGSKPGATKKAKAKAGPKPKTRTKSAPRGGAPRPA
jgi:anion-transporting  ArsA/GET3 family ATPase